MKIDEAYARLNIVQDFVPVGNNNRPGKSMNPSSITIHNTDNSGHNANAAAHAKYMKGADAQKRQVSWHYTVDDKFVYQSIPTNEIAWHTATKQGNATSIGIEICMNPELDVPKTYDRAALLVAVLAFRAGIQLPSALFQHHDWSGKDCPIVLRNPPSGWAKFVSVAVAKFKSLEPADAAIIAMADDPKHHHVEAMLKKSAAPKAGKIAKRKRPA